MHYNIMRLHYKVQRVYGPLNQSRYTVDGIIISAGCFRSFFQRLPASYMSVYTSTSQEANTKESFDKVWPSVVDSLIKSPRISEISDIGNWLQEEDIFMLCSKLMEYNLSGGKRSRGLGLVCAYETIERPENVTPESLNKARTLGWIVEMVQSYFLVADDMIDGSSTRRGKPCWYKLPHVDNGAINDVQLLKFSIYECLKTHFKKAPLYNSMVDIYNEAILFTSMGQHLDYTIKSDYSLFTIERYNSIVKYKTAYYSFKLPILLGYLLANNSDDSLHRKVEEVCLMVGRLAQIQNDFLDLYDESISGKNGTDIQEGKCSWLAVQALKLSNDAQRAFFIENYASKDPTKVQSIKHLYEELKLQELYIEKQSFLYERVVEKANSLPARDRKLLLTFVDMNYKQQQYAIKA